MASTAVSILQALAFLLIARLWGVKLPWSGLVFVIPALFVGGMMLGALGLVLSSLIRQLENFAGVMNFVIFPMFFLSTALYPLWKMAEASPLLAQICALNPFTQVVELIRFALYGAFNAPAFGWTMLAAAVFMAAALWGYDPARGMSARKGPPGDG
jgi:ABC-2 type transport system permease protein